MVSSRFGLVIKDIVRSFSTRNYLFFIFNTLIYNLCFFLVDIYMDNQLTNKLYYEEYSNVAVIFATILNFDIEVVGMRVLNEIICDFDEVVSNSLF